MKILQTRSSKPIDACISTCNATCVRLELPVRIAYSIFKRKRREAVKIIRKSMSKNVIFEVLTDVIDVKNDG